MRRVLIGCLLIGLGLPATSAVAAEPSEFRFAKEIRRDDDRDGILTVTLDSDVYAGTRADFADLRVFDQANQETPYLVEKVVQTEMHGVQTPCGSTVAGLVEGDDQLEVIVHLDDKAPAAEGLTIEMPLANFERRVAVLGSDDQKQWTPLVADALVFDYSRYMDVSNREVALPKNTFRWLKVVITGISDARESPFLDLKRTYRGGEEAERTEAIVLERRPFRIDRIVPWHARMEKRSESERKVDYPVAEWRVEEDREAKTTIVHVRTRRDPLTELKLETTNRNFSRAVTVEKPVTRGVRTEWVDLARGRVASIHLGNFHKDTLDLDFPETREAEYRIVIYNEDNPPLSVTGIAAQGNVYRVVLLAETGDEYRLAYGNDQLEPPRYDVAVVLGAARRGQEMTEGRLGEEVAGPGGGANMWTMRRLLKNPVFLGGVLVVLVVLLAAALLRAGRRINAIP